MTETRNEKKTICSKPSGMYSTLADKKQVICNACGMIQEYFFPFTFLACFCSFHRCHS